MDNAAMKIRESVGETLNAWMKESARYKNAKSLAKATGVGETTIDRIRAGVGNPTLSNIEAIARAFGKGAAELLIPPGGSTHYSVQEPAPQGYLPNAVELLGYLGDLEQPDADIFIQELKLAALKARRKRQERQASAENLSRE